MNKSTVRHLSEAEVTAYLDGEVSAHERSSIHAHLDACADCRVEIAELSNLLDAAPVTVPARPRRYWGVGLGIAMAASLAGLFIMRPAPQSEPRVRQPGAVSESRASIAVNAPPDNAVLPMSDVKFSWQGTPADVYRFTLLTADGTRVFMTETSSTSVSLPANVRLEPGKKYFWYVDAITDGITASSGMHRFTTW